MWLVTFSSWLFIISHASGVSDFYPNDPSRTIPFEVSFIGTLLSKEVDVCADGM